MTRLAHHQIELLAGCLAGVETVAISSTRSFPKHAHDQFGFGIMRDGGHVSWSECGQVEAGPGDVIAVSPNEIHDGAPIGDRRAWEMVFVAPETVERLVGRRAAKREIGFAAQRASHLRAELEHALRYLRNGDADAAEQSLTALLSNALLNSNEIGDRRPSAVTARVLDRIHDEPDKPPSLDDVAKLMGMHRTGALRRFRREVGATPHEYAMQLRVRIARRALASGSTPVEVAYNLGFADQSHLTRAFSRQFGLPPGRYRSVEANIVQD